MSLRDELQAIYDRQGTLTPDLVVREARLQTHPLHSRFEWDDSVAGEAYRRDQAQGLIRSVKIRYVSDDNSGVSAAVRAYTSVRTPGGSYAYEPTLEVLIDPLRRRMALADMKREWMSMMRRYRDYEEFWELVEKDLPGVPPESVENAQIVGA